MDSNSVLVLSAATLRSLRWQPGREPLLADVADGDVRDLASKVISRISGQAENAVGSAAMSARPARLMRSGPKLTANPSSKDWISPASAVALRTGMTFPASSEPLTVTQVPRWLQTVLAAMCGGDSSGREMSTLTLTMSSKRMTSGSGSTVDS
jgi:hypothetical protein